MSVPSRRPFVGGNAKMNLNRAGALALLRDVSAGVASMRIDVVAFPPFVYLDAVREALAAARSPVSLGAQDCWHLAPGAFTGEIGIDMLKDVGVTHVLTGHSERRHVMGESDELVGLKTAAVLNAGLTCVLCVGETLAQREAGETDAVNARQLRAGLKGVDAGAIARLVIAYEPVWAIGTGRNASPADAQAAHASLRALLGSMYGAPAAGSTRIIYGGSLKPDNAAALMAQPDIDGGLVGGASLVARDFLGICAAASARAG